MKRFLINCYTAWCGEEETYAAIAESEFDKNLVSIRDSLAYDNFMEGNGPDEMYHEEYPDIDLEDLTDEDKDAVDEGAYYGSTIEEWDETRPEEEWDWYELVYDANDPDVEEEDNDNEVWTGEEDEND